MMAPLERSKIVRGCLLASWIAAAFASVEGCTSSADAGAGAPPEVVADDSGTTPPPAQRDDAGATDPGDTGTPDDPVCGKYTGSDVYCTAAYAKCRECSSSTRPCEVANLKTCGQTSAAYSDAARSAAAACMAKGCPMSADEDCLRSRLLTAPRTAAQQKLVTAFCASCDLGAGAAACASRFFFRTPDGGTAPGLGPGARVMMVNDSLVGKIESTCISQLAGAGEACENVFFYCANQALSGVFPANACRDAGK